MCGIAAIAMFVILRSAPSVSAPIVVTGLSKLTDFQGTEYSPSLSPDGKTVLYSAFDDDPDEDIYRLRVGGQNPINLTADSKDHDSDPAFSPDGEQIAFFSTRMGGGIFVMGATGENPKRVCDTGFAPAWSPDGNSIVYTTSNVTNPYGRIDTGQLWRLDLQTKQHRQLDTSDPEDPDGQNLDAVEPAWSPDGSRIVYWTVRNGQRDLCSISADGGDRVLLTDDRATDWNPIWIDGGSTIVYLSDRGGQFGFWSITVDERNQAVGEPHPFMPSTARVVQAAASYDGSRLVIVDRRARNSIEKIEFDPIAEVFVGKPTTIYSTSGRIEQPDLSPDGEWFAFRDGPPMENIYVMKSDGSSRRRLTDSPYKDRGPKWAPDAQTLMYYSNKEGKYKVFEMNRDGTEDRMLMKSKDNTQLTAPFPSHAGTQIYAQSLNRAMLFERVGDELKEDLNFPKGIFVYGAIWSLDDRQLLGATTLESGLFALKLYRFETQSNAVLRLPDGDPIQWGAIPTWIDSDRFVGWEYNRQSVYIFNTKTNQTKFIESPFKSPQSFLSTKQGAEFYVQESQVDSELWLLELGKGPQE